MRSDSSGPAADAVGIASDEDVMPSWIFAIASACGIWYFFILLVQAIGAIQMYMTRHSERGIWC
jgi:hypothetical protein